MRFYRDKLGGVKRAELGDAVRVTWWRSRRLNQQWELVGCGRMQGAGVMMQAWFLLARKEQAVSRRSRQRGAQELWYGVQSDPQS